MTKLTQSYLFTTALLVVFFELAFLKPAHAYIDLGSASYAFSVLIAVLVSVPFVLKTFWAKLTSRIQGLLHRKRSE